MPRVFREEIEPSDFSNNISANMQTLNVHHNGEHIKVTYHQSTWLPVDIEGDGGIERRTTQGHISFSQKNIGAFTFNEFQGPPWICSEALFEEMDSYSAATSELAEAICDNWKEPSKIFEYGNLVELERSWMLPSMSKGGRFSAVLKALIREVFDDRSLLMLKAFPLEYEGRVDEETEDNFRRRQRALMRHYHNIVEANVLPGSFGKSGWMYVIPDNLRKCVPPPENG
ncbi:hypothetical protein [Sphingorhabdus sp. YGSMI21]|uniref:hypothetical protein n=1 Tax=Sphingorhabdus sp. YGSMI21 TaxID=2077182 RepID=UPI000C1DFD35|nr:hypothetical protein [Sphingorhabdus sp. YGSMI21]ATW02456.1 hypothetical protein CHN51_02155 [Sphingorhabdus sp. YGSMI21]